MFLCLICLMLRLYAYMLRLICFLIPNVKLLELKIKNFYRYLNSGIASLMMNIFPYSSHTNKYSSSRFSLNVCSYMFE